MIKQQTCSHVANSTVTHEEDDCEGCQAERKENNMLVDFYGRLERMENKVQRLKNNSKEVKDEVGLTRKKLQHMQQILSVKPQQILEVIKKQDSKQMGYQLASALIEREIKTKIENQRLQAIIDQLQREKKKMEEDRKQKQMMHSQEMTNSMSSHNGQQPQRKKDFWHEASIQKYTDVLDEVRRTKSIQESYYLGNQKEKTKDTSHSYFQNREQSKHYWQGGQRHSDTSFSNFTIPLESKSVKKQSQSKYEGLNLWLYDFKTQQFDHKRPTLKSQVALSKKNPSKYHSRY